MALMAFNDINFMLIAFSKRFKLQNYQGKSRLHMGEICESGFIEKIGHFLWDFQLVFWQLIK